MSSATLIYMGGLWSLYYALHSAFAAKSVKRLYQRYAPAIYPFYRLLYTAFALINFFLLMYLQLMLPLTNPFLTGTWVVPAGVFVISAGAIWTILALKSYNLKAFTGVDLRSTEKVEPLITTGMNALVRHPLYLGILVMLTGYLIYRPVAVSVVFVGVSLIYLVVGIRLEEKKLLLIYGDAYKQYQETIPALIPKIW